VSLNESLVSFGTGCALLAAGLRGGAFDEEVYQRMYSTNAQRDWEFLFPFIQTIQDQQGPTVYQEFEGLVKR